MTDEIDAEAAFAALAERFAREPDVEFETGFGSAPRAVDGAYIGSEDVATRSRTRGLTVPLVCEELV